MNDVQRCHDALLQQRTQIRHHKATFHWMKRCWQIVPRPAAPQSMTRDEFEDMYSILLYEMTICWEEELNDSILSKMWTRDAGSHATLNLDRFCCSLFAFVEMWVEEITLAEYEKILCHVYRILSGLDLQQQQMQMLHPTRSSSSHQLHTFKPTLESFNNALDNEKAMEELQMNFGKSISFNAQQYFQHFGTPTTHLQAFQATLLQMQSRVLRSDEQSDAANTQANSWSPSGRKRSPSRLLSKSPSRETSALRTSSPLPTYGGMNSPPRPGSPDSRRPVTGSRRSHCFVLQDIDSIHSLPTKVSPSRSSPEHRPRQAAADSFMMTGKSVLQF